MNIIKILFLCILFYFNIFISEAAAERKDIMENDGVDWINSSELFKVGYTSGFMSGLGVAEGRLLVYGDILKIGLEQEYLGELFNRKWNEISLYNITVGQITDGVNAFYKDFSNRRVKIVDAIYVVKMQIMGENLELIDAQIRYLKMQPISTEIYLECSEKWDAFFKRKGHYPTYKEIKDGDFSNEDLLRTGSFIDVNNKLHSLFCYGK